MLKLLCMFNQTSLDLNFQFFVLYVYTRRIVLFFMNYLALYHSRPVVTVKLILLQHHCRPLFGFYVAAV